ncbi:hypothetical protein ABZ904_48900 [Streptomyces sp. NPDC046900]|uniref:hypothetical protein n=1 Tax=Streptomyces sp. NPDC046900 TaxID=3155473 RepID=UPI0033E9D7DC
MAVLLTAAAATLWVSVPNLALAAQWDGTSGVMSIRSCSEVGPPKERHQRCAGSFRSDDGKTVDPDAAISEPLAPGTVLAVQRAPDGTYASVGIAAFLGWLAVTLLGAALGGAAVLIGIAPTLRVRIRPGWVTILVFLSAALLSALTGAIAGSLAG